ncbi:MAG: hypothetical protein FWD87_10930 [Spirochaetaceae bacterium]|nr:hypothetical protein [Spirochaetaceae bacterium]
MKNFWKFFGVVTLVVVAGFFLVSCGDDDDSVVYRDIMGRVALAPGSQGTADNKVVTGLAIGSSYLVLIEGADGHVAEAAIQVTRADGTLTGYDAGTADAPIETIADAVAAIAEDSAAAGMATGLDFGRTRVRGLENENSGFTYNFFKYLAVAAAATVEISDDIDTAIIDTRGRNILLDLSGTGTRTIDVGPGAGVAEGTTMIFYIGAAITTSVHNATLVAASPVINFATFSAIEDEDGDVRVFAVIGDDFITIRGINPETEFRAVVVTP